MSIGTQLLVLPDMASQTTSAATGGYRFVPLALDLNFGSITDGTDIPPPLESPTQKEPTPPATPPTKAAVDEPKAEPKAEAEPETKAANGSEKTPKTNGKLAGSKRPADDAPLSPSLSTRQGSLRRLFSRTTLNNSYLEGQGTTTTTTTTTGTVTTSVEARPQSQGAASFLDDRKVKRSSFFKRLRHGDLSSKRSSLMLDEVTSPTTSKRPSGPPPPMIPELADLEKDSGSLGDDLFKNIK